jgi:hypothetical protein
VRADSRTRGETLVGPAAFGARAQAAAFVDKVGAAGGLVWIDGVSVHPYVTSFDPSTALCRIAASCAHVVTGTARAVRRAPSMTSPPCAPRWARTCRAGCRCSRASGGGPRAPTLIAASPWCARAVAAWGSGSATRSRRGVAWQRGAWQNIL